MMADKRPEKEIIERDWDGYVNIRRVKCEYGGRQGGQ